VFACECSGHCATQASSDACNWAGARLWSGQLTY